jgi:two-component system, NtrC family, nitrogen regulation sensor histidine kinase NtrY
MFQTPEIRIALKVLILSIGLLATAFLVVKGLYSYLIFVLPIIVYSLVGIYAMLKKAQDEVREFVESIHYRDFSRNFNVRHAPAELQSLRQGFNEINSTFRVISKEKEVQYQYLQRILELVDTGIISYDSSTGETNWMNNAFKKMLNIPYLKNINALQKRDETLYDAVTQVKPGDTQVINITKDNRQIKVLIAATVFQTDGTSNKLIAFQNIHEALDENEALAWQKLLSVMTHEIMNSIAPIASLADTLKKNVAAARSPNTTEDLELGLETIKKRSEGLLKFAESYRNLNKITKPNRSHILVRDLFENILTLMQPTIEQKNIDLEVILKEPNLAADVDVNLIEQVLINLLVNAIEAVKDTQQPKITLSAYQDLNKLVLKIKDNGTGIPPQLLDKIFIPFFSTKKSGSGIGLSLCKQIMLLHKGTIQVQSVEGEGSVFKLLLPI